MTQVCSFRMVRVAIPRKRIQRAYDKIGYLEAGLSPKLRTKLTEINRAIARLEHVRSVVEKCLLKDPYNFK